MRLAAIAKNIKASGVCGVHYVGPLREVLDYDGTRNLPPEQLPEAH